MKKSYDRGGMLRRMGPEDNIQLWLEGKAPEGDYDYDNYDGRVEYDPRAMSKDRIRENEDIYTSRYSKSEDLEDRDAIRWSPRAALRRQSPAIGCVRRCGSSGRRSHMNSARR